MKEYKKVGIYAICRVHPKGDIEEFNVDQILKWFFDAIVSIVGSGYCSCLRKAPKNYS